MTLRKKKTKYNKQKHYCTSSVILFAEIVKILFNYVHSGYIRAGQKISHSKTNVLSPFFPQIYLI